MAIIEATRDHVEGRFPGSEFHVILWDEPDSPLFRRLSEGGVRVHAVRDVAPGIDQDDAPYKIPHDGHPNAVFHDRAAAYVAVEILGDAGRPSPSPRRAAAASAPKPR